MAVSVRRDRTAVCCQLTGKSALHSPVALNPFLCETQTRSDLPADLRKARSWPQQLKILLQIGEVLPGQPSMLLEGTGAV